MEPKSTIKSAPRFHRQPASFWQQVLLQWEQSDLSLAAFARREQISHHTLKWWRAKLRSGTPQALARNAETPRPGRKSNSALQRKAPSIDPPTIVPISLTPTVDPAPTTPRAQPRYEVHFHNQRALHFGPDFDDATLARLLRLLESP